MYICIHTYKDTHTQNPFIQCFKIMNLQLLEKGLKSCPITVYVKEDQACPLESRFLQQRMSLFVLLIGCTILT